jgi:hypothetical protein
VSILKNLRTFVKAVGLLDAFLDELDRERIAEQAEKERASRKMADIYQKASDLTGKDKTKH